MKLKLILYFLSLFVLTAQVYAEDRSSWIVFNCDDVLVAKLKITQELKSNLNKHSLSCSTGLSSMYTSFSLHKSSDLPSSMAYTGTVGFIRSKSHDDYNESRSTQKFNNLYNASILGYFRLGTEQHVCSMMNGRYSAVDDLGRIQHVTFVESSMVSVVPSSISCYWNGF